MQRRSLLLVGGRALAGITASGCAVLLLCSGCAASLEAKAEMNTRLDALAQTTAAIASNVNQTKQELTAKVDGVGNQLSTVTQNFDPATMHLIVRGVLYLAGGIVLLESCVLISNLWLARCRYKGDGGKCKRGEQ